MSTTLDEGAFSLEVEEEEDVIDPRTVPAATEPPKPKTPEEIVADNERLQQQVGALTAERDAAILGLKRPIEAPVAAPTTQPVQPDNQAARQQFETFLETLGQKQLAGDYKGATVDLLQFVEHMVNERTKAVQAPLATTTARQAVRNFEAQMRGDETFPLMEERFHTMVERAMPGIQQLPPDQQDFAIENIYKIAYADEALARRRNGRREAPPPYAAGSSSSGARPTTTARKLSAMQRQYVISAREAGIPEERIRAVLDTMERET